MPNDKHIKNGIETLLSLTGSGKLAIFLILLVCLFCILGAVLPQEGRFAPHEIATWQQTHPVTTSMFLSMGGFRVFYSVPFFLIIVLLGINTLTCTILRVYRLLLISGLALFRGIGGLRHLGFFVLHLSLILLFIGGAISSVLSMDGILVLVEEMTIQDEHDSYAKLVEGSARNDMHTGARIRLNVVTEKLVDEYPVDQAAHVTVGSNQNDRPPVTAQIRYNNPLQRMGLDFTLDKIGYAPKIVIFDRLSRTVPVDSFVVLKTFGTGPERRHHDYIAKKIFYERNQRVFLTVYPASATVDNTALLLVDIIDKAKDKNYHAEIPLNGRTDVGEYAFFFKDLKRWASFRVMDDPGYPVIWFGLWLGLAGIILRYLPDLMQWSGLALNPKKNQASR